MAGVLLSLNYSAIAQKATSPLPVEELRAFTEVFGAIKSNYVEPVEDKKLITEAINGMLAGLDPHSAYLDRDALPRSAGRHAGRIRRPGHRGRHGGWLRQSHLADRRHAGFQRRHQTGDLIIKLDETPVKGMSLNDAVKRMRGKPNTPIMLTVLRKGESKPSEFTLQRAVIKVQSVRSKMVQPGYGYVRVMQFQEHSGESLVRRSTPCTSKAPLKGLVLDLRNDPGGLLNGAVGIAAAFLPADVRGGHNRRPYRGRQTQVHRQHRGLFARKQR